MIRAGEVSASELVAAALERIAALDPQLNAFRVVTGERALLEARQADSRRGEGDERPLLGVPIAVKDNLDVAGEVTTDGTGAHGGPAQADAEVVRRLRAAGAIVVGKTHMSELGLWPWTESATWGLSRNPWAPNRTPGGSSGGSAAAVAARLVGAAHAADGGGSIRIPAAYCALFGLKPQHGRVPMAPKHDTWHGLAAYGFLTRTVADTALLLDVVADRSSGELSPAAEGQLSQAARRAPGRLRIAESLRPSTLSRLDARVEEAVRSTAELLRSFGHEVHEHEPAYGRTELAFSPLYLRSAYEEVKRVAHPERLERRTRGVARIGRLITPALAERAHAAGMAFAASVEELQVDHDVLLTPVVPAPPPPVGRAEGLGAWRTMLEHAAPTVASTRPWNVTAQPAASVPAGFTEESVPLAVQLVGRRNDEATVLSLAAQLEAERPWVDQRPSIG